MVRLTPCSIAPVLLFLSSCMLHAQVSTNLLAGKDPCKTDIEATTGIPNLTGKVYDIDLTKRSRASLILELKDKLLPYVPIAQSLGLGYAFDPLQRATRAVDEAEQDCHRSQVELALSGALPPARSRAAYSNPVGLTRAATGWHTADLNGDGLFDTALGFGNQILIQLGSDTRVDNGRLLTYAATQDFTRVLLADVTGDGFPDLVTCCDGIGSNRRISLIRGDGKGGLAATYSNLMPGAFSIALVDWNKDGKLDLAGLTPNSEPFIAIGNGDGTFQTPRLAAAAPNARLILAADTNRDGRPDLITFTASQVIVIPNNADGTFAAAIASNLPTSDISSMRFGLTGDWNADGNVDLAGLAGTELFEVLFGDGTGRFTTSHVQRGGVARGFSAVIPSNGNGAVFLLPDPNSTSVVYFATLSAGTIVDGPQLLRLPDETALTFRSRAMGAAADLNKDGLADAVVADIVSNNLRLATFLGKKALRDIPNSALPVIKTPLNGLQPALLAIFLEDFNGDNNRDALVVGGTRDPSLFLHTGDGRGNFNIASTTTLPLTITAAATADFNADQRADLALGAYTFADGGEVQVVLGGPSSLTLSTRIKLGALTPAAIATGDLNSDGKPDIAVITQDPNSTALALNLYLATGPTTFASAIVIPLNTSGFASALTIANIDATSTPEILLGLSGGLRIYRSTNAAWTQVDRGTTSFGGGATSILVNDFNGDSKPDLLLATCCGTSNYIHLGNGDGTFQAALSGPPFDSRAMFLADFNGDKLPEYAQAYDEGLVIHPATVGSRIGATVNGASFRSGTLAPGSIASLFARDLTSSTAAATALDQYTLADLGIAIRDRSGTAAPAALFYAAPGQVNLLVPDTLTPGDGVLFLAGPNGVFESPIRLDLVGPGLFTGDGKQLVGSITRVRNGAPSSADIYNNPIDLGPATDSVVLTLYATGLRRRSSLANVRVQFGLTNPITVPADYAGAQGAFAGLDQVNVTLPRSLAGRGTVEVIVTVDGVSSNVGAITVK